MRGQKTFKITFSEKLVGNDTKERYRRINSKHINGAVKKLYQMFNVDHITKIQEV